MLQFAFGLELALSSLKLITLLAQTAQGFEGPISGPLRKLVDGTMDLVYRRGLLDGIFIGAGSVLVLLVLSLYRRRS